MLLSPFPNWLNQLCYLTCPELTLIIRKYDFIVNFVFQNKSSDGVDENRFVWLLVTTQCCYIYYKIVQRICFEMQLIRMSSSIFAIKIPMSYKNNMFQ